MGKKYTHIHTPHSIMYQLGSKKTISSCGAAKSRATTAARMVLKKRERRVDLRKGMSSPPFPASRGVPTPLQTEDNVSMYVRWVLRQEPKRVSSLKSYSAQGSVKPRTPLRRGFHCPEAHPTTRAHSQAGVRAQDRGHRPTHQGLAVESLPAFTSQL